MKMTPSKYGFITHKTKFEIIKKYENKILEEKKPFFDGLCKGQLIFSAFMIFLQLFIYLYFKRFASPKN